MALGLVSEAIQDAEAAVGRGPRSATLFLNAACIYGQAAGQEQAQRTPPHLRQATATRYAERAERLVRAALDELPQEEERKAFWRQSVQPEPALAPARHLP